VEGLEEKVAGGSFVNKEGKILGQHKGYPFYTMVSVKALDITFGKPCTSRLTNPESNTVVLGDEEDLEKRRDAGRQNKLDEV
jgi:tRNA-specific 2-thiouridylase